MKVVAKKSCNLATEYVKIDYMYSLKTYFRYLLSVFFLLMFSAASMAEESDSDRALKVMDSLWNIIPQQKGEARMLAWGALYNKSLSLGDFNLQMQILDDWLKDAHERKDVEGEALARQNKITDFFNAALYDSVYVEVPIAMDFCKANKLRRKYFEAWHLLVCTYHITGKYNTALREVETMHDVAVKEKDVYGQAVAYFNMGNIYFSMGHYDESVAAYEKCLPLMDDLSDKEAFVLDFYPYFCDALEAKKDYKRLDKEAGNWWKYIESKRKKEGERDQTAVMGNYYIARTQSLLGQGKLNEARQMIDEAERLTSKEAFEWLYVLYYKAQYYLLTGQYDKAIELNTERVRMCDEIDDKPTLIPVHRQRAQIFMASGRYQEAAEAYKRTLELSDSLNTSSSRTQLNELNTLFKVDELEMQKHMQTSRFIIIIITLVALALLLLFIQYRRSAKRLKLKNVQLARSNAQFERKNEELVVANARAEESSRMKTDFIQQISHEIRTPLNILSGFTQIITMPGVSMEDAEKEEIGQHITDNVDRITNLVDKMLDLADASSQMFIDSNDKVSATQIAEIAVADSNIKRAEHLRFELQEEAGAGNVMLRTNQRYAVRALCLLLDNAQKFTRPAESYVAAGQTPADASLQTVLLKVYMKNETIHFVVEDTGIGIPPEEAVHIFDRFVQLDEYYDGTGIGLTVARSIARRLGGDIVLDTTYTNGARFVLTLPVMTSSR